MPESRREAYATHPKFVHLAKVLQDEFNRILHSATVALILTASVRQLVASNLAEIVAQEETSHRMLNSTAQLYEIEKNVLRRSLL
jgi:hypothetical protein